MTGPLLTISGLCKHYDGVVALDEFSCNVCDREIVGLMGPNGAGKTTLFNVITGLVKADSGTARFSDIDVLRTPARRMVGLGIARTFQDVRLIRGITILENVLLACQNQPGETLRSLFLNPLSARRTEMKNSQIAMALLEDVGLAEMASEMASSLSYGQQKLLSIACCLATKSRLLLLDEPVAGVAPQMVDHIMSIVTSLPERGKTIIMIEHDVDRISQICERVIFMDEGKVLCEGSPIEVRRAPCVMEAYLE